METAEPGGADDWEISSRTCTTASGGPSSDGRDSARPGSRSTTSRCKASARRGTRTSIRGTSSSPRPRGNAPVRARGCDSEWPTPVLSLLSLVRLSQLVVKLGRASVVRREGGLSPCLPLSPAQSPPTPSRPAAGSVADAGPESAEAPGVGAEPTGRAQGQRREGGRP
jgi:hypothetical protein